MFLLLSALLVRPSLPLIEVGASYRPGLPMRLVRPFLLLNSPPGEKKEFFFLSIPLLLLCLSLSAKRRKEEK